ncbi:MAG: adenosylcobinamide amidohydrolase [Thermoplasmatales archaeon]|nr:adenosylcobinamide amidohydrolase [Thermoplasmatales archaeon]
MEWEKIIRYEKPGKRRKIHTLPGGEEVFVHGRSLIIVPPDSGRAVLSSAASNGGYFEGPSAITNTTSLGGDAGAELMMAGRNAHERYWELSMENIGVDPLTTVGLGTAVTMDKASITTESSGGITVSAVVTAGVEGNGGRAGDPATYNELDNAIDGTIVIILIIDANLPPHAMARAIITATEAKTCVLQQLMARSLYSHGIASGTGTDQVAVVCNRNSDVTLHSAGKHSLLGELIGKCVMKGVYAALDNWASLTPLSQRDVLKRIERYGITEDDVLEHCEWADRETAGNNLRRISSDGRLVSAVASVLHIEDEIGWGLLDPAEGRSVGNGIIVKSFSEILGANLAGDIDPDGDLIGNITAALGMSLSKPLP